MKMNDNKESRLQFLLRKNKGKQLLPEYQKQLSRLVIGDNFKTLNLEDSDTISAAIIKNGELYFSRAMSLGNPHGFRFWRKPN